MFKTLFDDELTIEGGNFKLCLHILHTEADGLKPIFNLLYYLVSLYKIIILDEPERFLHSSMRIVFISLISEGVKNYGKIIIITSHFTESIRYDLDNVKTLLLLKEKATIELTKVFIRTNL